MRSSPVITAVSAQLTSMSAPDPRIVTFTEDDELWLRIARVLAPYAAPSRARGQEAVAATDVDLIVLHVNEPHGPELVRVRQLKDQYADETPAVLICEQLNARSLRRSLDAGINGLLLSTQVEGALGPTVDAALAGQVSIPREFGASLRRRPLSFREKQIVGLAVVGYTNSQIGGRLYLAESTVKSHLSSSFIKLGVSSRSEAAALVNDPDEPLGLEIIRIASRIDGSHVASAV